MGGTFRNAKKTPPGVIAVHYIIIMKTFDDNYEYNLHINALGKRPRLMDAFGDFEHIEI